MRTRRGAVRSSDAQACLTHQADNGVREYRETPGNMGVLVLTRERDDLVEVATVSFWESMDAVDRFAGDDPERAELFPGDDDLLTEKDLHADHVEVDALGFDRTLLTV